MAIRSSDSGKFAASPLIHGGEAGERRTFRFRTAREKEAFIAVASRLRSLADKRRRDGTPIERFVFGSSFEAEVAYRYRDEIMLVAGLESLEPQAGMQVRHRQTARAVPKKLPGA